jgi:hypothetical protein
MLLQNLVFIIILFAPMIIASDDTTRNEEQNGKFASARGLFPGQKWRPWNKLSNSKSDSVQKDESGSGLNGYTPAGNSSAREGKCKTPYLKEKFIRFSMPHNI